MPKRKYLGNHIWEIRYADGSVDIEIACTEDEDAAQKADAARAGMTVEQLMKSRLLSWLTVFR